MIIAGVSALIIVATMISVLIEIIQGASMAISHYGPGFITSTKVLPNKNEFGALPFIYGTLVTSLVSVFFSTLIGVSIGLFLALMAPKSVATIIGPLIEMLAAVPTVLLGLIGIIVIAPFSQSVLMPAFHAVLGFTGLFGAGPNAIPNTGISVFTASLVLTIMVVPIIAALTRDIFMTVPQELTDGAEALGATRWEMIRGVVLPTTVPGIVGACVLGFARAIGEAIAVIQVCGNAGLIHANLFLPGSTIAAEIANDFESPQNPLELSAFYYLILILFVISILTNLISRYFIRRSVKL
jgi:phosphate transport system permease protein